MAASIAFIPASKAQLDFNIKRCLLPLLSSAAHAQAMLEPPATDNQALAEKIRRAIKQSPLTKVEIAEEMGVSPQAITGWEKNGRIGKFTLPKLAALLGIPLEHFVTSEHRPAIEPEWDDVLGYAQGVGLGDGVEANEYAETHKLKFRADSLARKRLHPAKLAVMYGQGDSMLPRIRTGDAVLFDTADTRARDEALFVIQCPGVNGNAYSVKRCRHFGDDVYFDALNPEGDHGWRKPRRMDDKKHPITIIGRVRWIGSWED